MSQILTTAGVGVLVTPPDPTLYEVWTLDAAGDWHRAGKYASRAEAEGAVPNRGRDPKFIILPVSASYSTRAVRVTATNATDDPNATGTQPAQRQTP